MNREFFRSKKFIYIAALVFIVLFSVGYSALSQTLNINGNTRYGVKYPVRVTGIVLQGVNNSGEESFNPNYTWNTTTTGVNLPNLNSEVIYSVTIQNFSDSDKTANLSILNNNNSNMTYEIVNMANGINVPANDTVTFDIKVKYNSDVSELPSTTTDTMTIAYSFTLNGAMFKTGKEVNTRMKQFVNANATYESNDSTISNISRYTGTPNSSYLIDANLVSVSDSMYPIYMWYDSGSSTIYWYTEASNVYFNYDSSYFYANLVNLASINNLNDIKSVDTTNMSHMFYYTSVCEYDPDGDCYNETSFTLNLGSNFETKNVTDMSYMFGNLGSSNRSFNIDLGPNFDTSSVTNMSNMFSGLFYRDDYYGSTSHMQLSLGAKFDTSKVTNMSNMFSGVCNDCGNFELNLGEHFNTSNVTSMEYMFSSVGSLGFTLDLGNHFDTSNVTNMSNMFAFNNWEYIDLGPNFDTSNVTNMTEMFNSSSELLTIYAPSTFVTTNVTLSSYMFSGCLRLEGMLGTKFDSSHIDKEYAHIDGGSSNPGYLSSRSTNSGAMFDYGTTVNAKMKRFVNADSSYMTTNNTIKDIVRYTNTPSSSNMTSDNIVSISFSEYPIYMWYESSNQTIYWYSDAVTVYYSPSCLYFYGNLESLNSITSLNDINTSYARNMSNMFYNTGYSSTTFVLNLGSNFDTSNVTSMGSMFYNTGYSSPVFTLNLGSDFDTSNVTNMSSMFYNTGYNSNSFTLDLGNKFNTVNVSSMSHMFYATGREGSLFTLNLGNNFDTSNVTNMNYMFYYTGSSSPTFTLDLGSKFDTSKVSYMDRMFSYVGYDSTVFTLNLGNNFNTSLVTNMSYMFYHTGSQSTVFSLNLGNNFDTSNVTNMSYMFYWAGHNSNFDLDLGPMFNTSKVKNMSYMFYGLNVTTIYAPTTFVTTAVTSQTNMFTGSDKLVGGEGTVYTSSSVGISRAKIDGGLNSPGYFTTRSPVAGAMFKRGQDVNARMKQFVYSRATYSTDDTTITNIVRFTGTPNSSYLVDSNIVSVKNYASPIYMWYDSSATTIYWYTTATNVYYNSDSSYFYHELEKLSGISDINYINSTHVINMASMFRYAGYSNVAFTLNLGSNFDTSNVTNMNYMFSCMGYDNTSLVLDLGSKFDTSKVTNMASMFNNFKGTTIYAPTTFVTTAVTSSTNMFYECTNLAGSAGTTYNSSNVTATYAHIDGGTGNPGYFSEYKYYIDLNGRLNGTDSGNLGTYGKCSVKINGTVVNSAATDYYAAWPTGTTYQFTCSANTGYSYDGVVSGSLSGTVGTSNVSIRVGLSTINYTITYNVNGGTSISDGTYNILSLPYALPVATKSGSLFGGWYANEGLTGSPVTQIPTGSTGNKTYYAKWVTSGYQGYTLIKNYSGSSDDGSCNGNTPSGYTKLKCFQVGGSSYDAYSCMFYKATRISPTTAEVHVYTRQYKNDSGYFNGYLGLANTISLNSTSMTPTDTTCQTNQAGIVSYSGPNGTYGQAFVQSIRYRNLSLDYKFHVGVTSSATSVTMNIGQKYCGLTSYCNSYDGSYAVTIS